MQKNRSTLLAKGALALSLCVAASAAHAYPMQPKWDGKKNHPRFGIGAVVTPDTKAVDKRVTEVLNLRPNQQAPALQGSEEKKS